MQPDSYSKLLNDNKTVKTLKSPISSKKKIIEVFNVIIDALNAYKGNYHKKFNFEKLITQLPGSIIESGDIIKIILKFQELFHTTFKDYELIPKKINNTLYFTTKANPSRIEENKDENIKDEIIEIRLAKNDLNILNDIVYMFKHVNRGKGFNLALNNSDLINNIKTLNKIYPEMFYVNGNNLVYPSKLGLELGETINSYFKCNRIFEVIMIDNYKIRVL
ncbi:MAG: hypothetical protein KGD57_05020 [Candidatus Lokiarchaeota archaeon]|nr:hypothetical protein [Candidatus Lokiarchaeota archaeon]